MNAKAENGIFRNAKGELVPHTRENVFAVALNMANKIGGERRLAGAANRSDIS
jgi:hypothetical protein